MEKTPKVGVKGSNPFQSYKKAANLRSKSYNAAAAHRRVKLGKCEDRLKSGKSLSGSIPFVP